MKKIIFLLSIIYFQSAPALCNILAADLDCVEIISDYSGWSSSFTTSNLDEKTCELKEIIETPNPTINFRVFTETLYPSGWWMNDNIYFKQKFDSEVQKCLDDTSVESFIFFTKEYHPEEEIFHNRCYFNAPNINSFNSLTNLELEVIQNEINNLINSTNTASTEFNSNSESAIIEYLIDFLENGFDTSSSIWEKAGFVAIDENDGTVERSTKDEITVYNNLTFHNESNYNFDGIPIEDHLMQQMDLSTSGSDLSYAIYITGVEEMAQIQHFESLTDDFYSDQSHIRIWIHFDFATEIIDDGTIKNDENNTRSSTTTTYYLVENNLTQEKSEEILNAKFEEIYNKHTYDDGTVGQGDCSYSAQWGKNCIYNNSHLYCTALAAEIGCTAQVAVIAGFIDGGIGTYEFLKFAFTRPIPRVSIIFIPGLLNLFLEKEAIKQSISRIIWDGPRYSYELMETAADAVNEFYLKFNVSNPLTFTVLILEVYFHMQKYLKVNFNGSLLDSVAYYTGIAMFDVGLGFLSAGIAVGLRGAQIAKRAKAFLGKPSTSGILKGAADEFDSKFISKSPKARVPVLKTRNCFIKDTPVLVANKNYNNTPSNKYNFTGNPFRNNTKALAVAAAMPIVAVPIQDVQLLDYAVAHETVNSTYGLTASTNDDIYVGLMDKDPYTSDQQRERDEYEINDTDWNEVVFEEVLGGSTAKLALHREWINQEGYQVDGVVNLDLPEQGISGPFKITSIKHILPQKKPVDDDVTDEYNYRPVTALFTHESDKVYNISFDNGESLGVTYQHPIYSTTTGDWKLAGELEIEEEVLTKSGITKVVSSAKKEGSETVYNLEVKELHNFLVGESGIVVHNSCGWMWNVERWYGSVKETCLQHIKRLHLSGSGLNKSHYGSHITDANLEDVLGRTMADYASNASNMKFIENGYSQGRHWVIVDMSPHTDLLDGAGNIGKYISQSGNTVADVKHVLVTVDDNLNMINAFPTNKILADFP